MEYVDDEGKPQRMTLPLTVADWAATEARFKKHFKAVPPESWNEDMVPFHEFIGLAADEKAGKTPFIWTRDPDGKLSRLSVTVEMVKLADERLLYWNQLREMAGLEVSETVRDLITSGLESEFDQRFDALRIEYEARLADLKATYPQIIARKLAEGLLRSNGSRTVAELLDTAIKTPGLEPVHLDGGAAALLDAPAPAAATAAATAPAAVPAPVAAVAEEELGLEAYIETDRCTSCNECTNLNGKMFAYNDNKQAYIKDPKAGTFAQLVQAAEKCPAAIIHPGTPLNPKEKDLEKWLKRAAKFN
jgi:pyruvate-ferredoxin/flavodoxin oxidoreductase